MGVIVRSSTDKTAPGAAAGAAGGAGGGLGLGSCPPRCRAVLSADWGVIVETPPVHPGLAGTVLPWVDGLQFKVGLG